MSSRDRTPALIGVIADDMTGANATGILLRRQGFRTLTLTGQQWPEALVAGYDCVCLNTESRAVRPQVAYSRVAEAAQLLLTHGSRPFSKRIDSTLRGNLGPELEAILAQLGPDAIAVVTGAYPAGGRTTREGVHYVGDTPLAETPVRHDPLCPVLESHVPTLLRTQTDLATGLLPLETVRLGTDAIAQMLQSLAGAGIRVICADAETESDLQDLGAGMVRSGLPCVAVDPGPLTAAFVAASAGRRRRRVLVVNGSTSPTTAEQLNVLERELKVALVQVDARALTLGPESRAAEVRRVVDALAGGYDHQTLIGVRTGPQISLTGHELSERIADGFAQIAQSALERIPGIDGLFTGGGDITLAVCQRLGAAAIDLTSEVLPLAVFGRLLGGRHHGLPLVTKGGLVGGPDAAVRCVTHILREGDSCD